MKTITIGTRGSDLALYQAKEAQKILNDKNIPSQIKVIKTRGDKDYRPFQQLSGDSFFTKEIEAALLNNEIDLAIHSAKDLASLEHLSLPWEAFGTRADVKDILIVSEAFGDITPQSTFTVGSSSPRRIAQLKVDYPNCKVVDLRGNVPSRLQKVANNEINATILAKAGLDRLQLLKQLPKGVKAIELNWTTAPCQGIMVAQSRQSDLNLLEAIKNPKLSKVAKLEKSVLAYKGGGCHMAIGCSWMDDKASVFYADTSNWECNDSFDESDEFQRWNQLLRASSNISLTRPLGNVVLTHSIRNQEKVATLLAQNNLMPWFSPLFEIKSLVTPKIIEEAMQFYKQKEVLLAFSSQYAAQFFVTEALNLGFSIDDFKTREIYAVGKSTAQMLQNFGINDVKVPKNQSAVSLLEEIRKDHPFAPILHPTTERSKLRSLLTQEGHKHLCPFVYQSEATQNFPKPKTVPKGSTFFFASPFSVNIAIEQFGRETLSTHPIFAMGRSTFEALKENRISAMNNNKSGSWEHLIEQFITYLGE